MLKSGFIVWIYIDKYTAIQYVDADMPNVFKYENLSFIF